MYTEKIQILENEILEIKKAIKDGNKIFNLKYNSINIFFNLQINQ